MFQALHSRDDKDKVYVSWNEERDLYSIVDSVDVTIYRHEKHKNKTKERQITAASGSNININNLRKTTMKI